MTMQKLIWQDYAEWITKIVMSAVMLYAGIVVVEKYQFGLVTQVGFWLVYPPFMYWIVIREIYFKRPEITTAPTGSLRIVIPLQNNGFGSYDEREKIHRLTDELDALLTASGNGAYDGDEFGEGECTLFMYGDDPDAMYESISAVLTESSLVSGGKAQFLSPSSGKPYKVISL